MTEEIAKVKQNRKQYHNRNEGDDEKFPQQLHIRLRKDWNLKYGENPHQQAAMYVMEAKADGSRSVIHWELTDSLAAETDLRYMRTDDKGKGGLSATNTADISRGMQVLTYFQEPAAAMFKHNILSGFATSTEMNLEDLFRTTRDVDRRSNFGGTLVVNRPIEDSSFVDAMYELSPGWFVDVVAAPGYGEGIIDQIQENSKKIRIAQFSNLYSMPKFIGDETYGVMNLKDMLAGRVVVQDPMLTGIRGPEFFRDAPLPSIVSGKERYRVERKPTEREAQDLYIAHVLDIAGCRSNGVVFVKDGVAVSLGSGNVERVGATESAIIKGMQKAMGREGIPYEPLEGIKGYEELKVNPFEGAVVKSDGFFPFRDSVDTMAKVGVSAMAQPFGSKRDAEVIQAIIEHNMAAVATKERGFGHF